MKQFFNTSVNRETSNVWRFRIVKDQETNFVLTEFEINPQDSKEKDTMAVFNAKQSLKEPHYIDSEEDLIKLIQSKSKKLPVDVKEEEEKEPVNP